MEPVQRETTGYIHRRGSYNESTGVRDTSHGESEHPTSHYGSQCEATSQEESLLVPDWLLAITGRGREGGENGRCES